MELLGDVGHVESSFGPFRDDVSVDKRTIGSDIVLDTANGTPG